MDKEVKKAMFNETCTLKEKLAELNPELPKEKFSSTRIAKWQISVKKHLNDMEYGPNNNQLGVAITSALMLA